MTRYDTKKALRALIARSTSAFEVNSGASLTQNECYALLESLHKPFGKPAVINTWPDGTPVQVTFGPQGDWRRCSVTLNLAP